MTHTNFKILIPGQTRREMSDDAPRARLAPVEEPPVVEEPPAVEAAARGLPEQREPDHDFYAAYARVHALLTGAEDDTDEPDDQG